jgi:hypothetical protein
MYVHAREKINVSESGKGNINLPQRLNLSNDCLASASTPAVEVVSTPDLCRQFRDQKQISDKKVAHVEQLSKQCSRSSKILMFEFSDVVLNFLV